MAGIVCCILYGDYPELHRRFLNGLRTIPSDVPVFLGLNAVATRSLETLEAATGIPVTAASADGHAEYGRYRVFTRKNTNRYKYPVMREMFSQLGDRWSLWLDDDTMLPADPAWWRYLVSEMERGVDYTGVEYSMRYQGRQLDFIRSRPWYRGVPPKTSGTTPVFTFYTGSFWGLSARARQLLDWPDPLLHHNGGDTLLGEAVRQNALLREPFPCHRYGIKINSAKRRGHTEVAIGVRP